MKLNGLEYLIANPSIAKSWGRLGLVCNQASIAHDWQSSWDLMARTFGSRLRALFGPQHGFYGTVQDNMIETDHAVHLPTGLPLFSLYSETREPTTSMLELIDTLVVDLQIVGCRIYTWKATIAGCMRAAKREGKKVVVLDRPNPVGGEVLEGRVLDMDATSFVGEYPIPMRHGLTAGEAARFFNRQIQADLEVVKLVDWSTSTYWSDLGRPWVLTSPNLPTIDAVYVYPGTVLLEGTNVSEGRGTGLPFQFVGAPWIKDQNLLILRVHELLKGTRGADGVFLRPASFQPVSQKWQGKACNGVQIHVTDFRAVRSFDLTLALIRAMIEFGQENASSEAKFEWKAPPYEYDFLTLPIKLIFGSQLADQKFEADSFSLEDAFWHSGHVKYLEQVQDSLLYPRRSFEFRT
jgi:uncharacterized protein YbbC (DUF1343 family)